MTGGDEPSQTAGLKLWAHEARVRSAACKEQAVRAAESAAVRREQAERMIDRMAERNPQYPGPLRAATGTAAGRQAAIVTPRRDWGAADQPGDPLVAEPLAEPEAAVIAGLEVYLRDMAIAWERDRMARELQDTVVQRVFAAGLMLHGAAGLTTQPGVRRRIEAAADELDEVVRVIRDAVFNLPGPSAGHEPGGG